MDLNTKAGDRVLRRKGLLTRKRVIIALLLLMLFFLYLCAPGSKQKLLSITEKVTKQDIVTQVLASGKLEAAEDTTVGAQTTGEIKALHVKIGDTVKKGDLIAELDPTVATNNLAKTKDELTADQARLNSLKRKIVVAKSELDSYALLYRGGAASKTQYDARLTNYQELINESIQVKAKINQDELTLQNMNKNLSYTRITAPMAGIIVSLPVDVGQILTAGYTTPTVAKIANLDQMNIRAEISEADIVHIKKGQKASFTLVGNGSKSYPATVEIVHPAPISITDGIASNSNNYYTILKVEQIDPSFKVNLTTTVHITTGEKDGVLAVSSSAIHERKGKSYVTVLDSQHKKLEKQVQTGFSNGTKTEILSGLVEGETVLKEAIATEQ
ncbi:MAG: efflux RND transporter periplasmic adaptor subunit [Neisseriaceae bacterium]